MPAADATKLLRSHQWREGDVALLQALAAVEAPNLLTRHQWREEA